MRNVRLRILITMAILLLASLAVPVDRDSAAAQSWERVAATDTTGADVAFERRDAQGRVYYRHRIVWDGRALGEGGERHAADCSERLLYVYDAASEKWGDPLSIMGTPQTTWEISARAAFKYACDKYRRTTLAKPPQLVQLRLANVDDIGRAFVNGQQVSEITCSENTCTNDTGWVDVTKKMKPGRNTVSFHLDNGKYGGWKYRLQLSAGHHKYDSGIVGRDACPCNAPVLKLQIEVLVSYDGDIESISKPDITYFSGTSPTSAADWRPTHQHPENFRWVDLHRIRRETVTVYMDGPQRRLLTMYTEIASKGKGTDPSANPDQSGMMYPGENPNRLVFAIDCATGVGFRLVRGKWYANADRSHGLQPHLLKLICGR